MSTNGAARDGEPVFRVSTEADIPVLAGIYRQSVLTIGSCAYDEEQVEVWASFATEPDFTDFILSAHTFLAICDEQIVGFAGMTNAGHLTSLYVLPEWGRRGIAGDLIARQLDRARTLGLQHVRTEASAISRPVFLRCGFQEVYAEESERKGVLFRRYRMHIEL